MSRGSGIAASQPERAPAEIAFGDRLADWSDRHARQIFIAPALVLIVIFAIFPTIASMILAVSRLRLTGSGFTFRFVGGQNFERQLFGSEQVHFLGRLGELSAFGWLVAGSVGLSLLWWLWRSLRSGASPIGMVGRLLTAALLFGIALMFAATVFSGNPWGTLGTTLFYVFVGCSIQFVIGLGLALLCSQPIRGRNFFRVLFFIPLMITPIGVGYAFRMIADTTKGPFAHVWQWVGLGNFAWAADPWAARLFIIVGDSWQWIPFIFIVMLAALENVPRDFVEAAHVDGASRWEIFSEVTWPQIMPVAATVMLIRVIEAFKIVDLPNIMTSGGPGIATESITLQSVFAWRSLDLGQSAALAYLLLFVTVVLCSAFFNFIVVGRAKNS